jgi:sec-independent protein translocase protein TatA
MGSLSIWHWLVILAVILLLFGKGKVSDLMGDLAKGVKAFKKGLAEDETAPAAQSPKVLTVDPAKPAVPVSEDESVKR